MTSTQVSVYIKSSSEIPGLTSFPSTLTVKKVYKDEIFGRQDKLQFISRESKDYKCLRKMFGG